MSDGFGIFLGGALVGVLMFAAIVINIPAGRLYEHRQAIEQCEKELPRNQTCVITAIPVKRREQ